MDVLAVPEQSRGVAVTPAMGEVPPGATGGEFRGSRVVKDGDRSGGRVGGHHKVRLDSARLWVGVRDRRWGTLGNTLGSHRPTSERTTPPSRHEGRVGFVPQRGLGREVSPISEEEDAEIRTPRRIVCVTSGHHTHRHIANAHQHLVSIGIGGTAAAPGEILTVEQIRDAIAAGESFYTYSASTQRVSFVHSATCQVRGCNVETIRSNGDAVADNNLDNLAPCP